MPESENFPADGGADLARIIQDANQRLSQLDPSPFTAPAFDALQQSISRYIAELVAESARRAKRQGMDNISETHVEYAGEYLVSNTRRNPFRHLGTIGGVFLGAAASNLLTMAASEKITFPTGALTVGFGVVGAFMIALHIARD